MSFWALERRGSEEKEAALVRTRTQNVSLYLVTRIPSCGKRTDGRHTYSTVRITPLSPPRDSVGVKSCR